MLMLSALLRVYAGWDGFAHAAIAALLAFCILGRAHFRRREKFLFTVAGLMTIAEIAMAPDAGATIFHALDRASFLAAFMLLLAVLRDAAATSPSVEASGRFLTRQPPRRRYGAIALGAHVLTVLLNMGALNMLAPLIGAGVRDARARGEPERIVAVKERRQLSACLRGFATAITWAPTTVTQALLATLIPGADPWVVIGAGLGFVVLSMALGMAEDVIRWAPMRRELARTGTLPARSTAPAPRRALAGVAMACAALAGLAFAVIAVAGVETVAALMVSAPLLTAAWIAVQNLGCGPRAAAAETARRCGAILSHSVPASSPEAITLAVAGYIGIMLAALAPTGWAGHVAATLHPVVLMAVLPLVILIAVQVALTPIVMAVFLGSALSAAGPLPIDPALLILSIAGGWAIALTASPFAAGALVMSRASGIPAATLSWRWNMGYSAMLYALLIGWLALLHAVL
ncbi:MAG: hypothetical protein ACJAVR_001016 [Paracoccaceae bacterium]|jgi:hypothetical protein